jgi:N-acetylglucosamine kinase-like BadF-type ATPase
VIVLGVDGGNTKTLAVVASADGAVLGTGRAGCGDIYGAGSPALAIREIVAAAETAMSAARVVGADLAQAGFSLAGADWPEDFAFLAGELGPRLGIEGRLSVVNDAIGALRLAGRQTAGVAVVVGTGGAIGARDAGGVPYHMGWWPDGMGAGALGRAGWRAVYRSHLGIGPPTTLTARAVQAFQVADPMQLLHLITHRGGLGQAALTRLATAVLDEASAGDRVAAAIVAGIAGHLAEIAGHCAARTELDGTRHPLVFAGGVLAHPRSSLLTDAVIARLPHAEPVWPELPPVVGALLTACDAAGIDPPAAGFALEST